MKIYPDLSLDLELPYSGPEKLNRSDCTMKKDTARQKMSSSASMPGLQNFGRELKLESQDGPQRALDNPLLGSSYGL